MTVKVTSVESRRNPCTIIGGEGIVIADTDEIRAKKNPFCERKVRISLTGYVTSQGRRAGELQTDTNQISLEVEA